MTQQDKFSSLFDAPDEGTKNNEIKVLPLDKQLSRLEEEQQKVQEKIDFVNSKIFEKDKKDFEERQKQNRVRTENDYKALLGSYANTFYYRLFTAFISLAAGVNCFFAMKLFSLFWNLDMKYDLGAFCFLVLMTYTGFTEIEPMRWLLFKYKNHVEKIASKNYFKTGIQKVEAFGQVIVDGFIVIGPACFFFGLHYTDTRSIEKNIMLIPCVSFFTVFTICVCFASLQIFVTTRRYFKK